MIKITSIFILCIIVGNVYAQESITILNCKCFEKKNVDFVTDTLLSSGEVGWQEFQNSKILRNKIFTNLDSDKPIVKSISPPSEYLPKGEVNEFTATVIHHSGDMIILKWQNPYCNKLWIATINLKHKKVIVTESYDGLTSFGMNVEVLNCKSNNK